MNTHPMGHILPGGNPEKSEIHHLVVTAPPPKVEDGRGNVEKLQEYVNKCGFADKDAVVVDGQTLVLSNSALKLDSLVEPCGVDYYIGGFDCPEKYRRKRSTDSFDIYGGDSGVFVVARDTRHLLLISSIYEANDFELHGNIVSITGHEETATIVLKNLEESFSYHTR